MEKEFKLVVGLGNPGREYVATRHNVGFMVVEKVIELLKYAKFEEKYLADSRVFIGKYRGKELVLQLPQTFMNLSGKAVSSLANKLKISSEQIVVLYDDLYLTPGKLRLRNSGSSGGHNGINSIIEELGSEKFSRIRVGIGQPVESANIAKYVLEEFSETEKELFNQVLTKAAEATIDILKIGMSRAMNKYNNWEPTLEIEQNKNDNQ